jgi:subtilisin-like proprotein convertase family protein
LATVVLGLVSVASAQPTVDEDLGSLVNGTTVTRIVHVGRSEAAHWFSFTIPNVPASGGVGQIYLDIRTTNPTGNTTWIMGDLGLYDATGNFATGTSTHGVDHNEGPGTAVYRDAALSYGATCPTRPNNATAPATINGTLFNGRDGALAAGTYYLAIVRDFGTFTTPWGVAPPTTGADSISGNVQVEITLGTTGTPPPVLTASSATPPSVNSGALSLLTVTANGCISSDKPTSMTIDLSSVGGSATAPMYDNGTNGDATANDNIWSLSTPITAAPGTYTLTATATNVFNMTATRSVTVTVSAVANTAMKISQIDGTGYSSGSGLSWAAPCAEYVEVHNTSGSALDLSGWAVQATLFDTCTSASAWVVRPFPAGFIIPAGGYATVQFGTQTTPHNDPNWTGDTSGYNFTSDVVGAGGSLSSAGGKVALTNSQAPLTTCCPTSDPTVVDFVGYGVADCSKGSPAPAPGLNSPNALYRGCNGNSDTGNNSADFSLALASPRNRSSPPNMGTLTAVGAPVESGTVSVTQNSAVLLTATASSCAGSPSGVHFTANLSFVGGPSSAPMYDDGTHGDAVAGDGTFSLSYTVPESLLPAPPPGPAINRPYVVPMTATDSLGRSATTYAAFYVTAAPTGACCVNGQVTVRTQTSCVAAGGAYFGDNSSPTFAAGSVYTSGNNVSVPDTGSRSDSVTINDATTISRLIVHFQAQHPYLGDLTCKLSNGTTTVTLFDQVGVGTNNATGRPGNLTFFGSDYDFMDGGASFWSAAYNGGKDTNFTVPGGFYAPSAAHNAASSLAPFIGQSAQGTWTMTVTDSEQDGYTGSFMWSLEVNPVAACAAFCSADFNNDGDIGTDADIEAFFACLAGNCCATCGSPDFNGDGDIGTDADIESFFRVLGGGPC